MSKDLLDAIARLGAQLDRIEKQLTQLAAQASAPSLGLTCVRLSNTRPGPLGQVVPGTLILEGKDASDYFTALGEAALVTLADLPPWTHMALADKSWWLVQMA
jgi:hypothetical protein